MPDLNSKLYVVIGLGNFGTAVATTIANAGVDVIVVDKDPLAVQEIAEVVPHAVCADSRDIEMLKEAGVRDADVAILSMGSSLEASVITILNLKEFGVPTIIAKANNERYKFVMESIGADTVIQPENEMGQRVGISLINPKITDIYQVTSDFIIMEIKVPELWQGRKISELNLREIYGVNIIGIRKEDTKKVDININKDTILTAQDYLTIAADATRIAALNLD